MSARDDVYQLLVLLDEAERLLLPLRRGTRGPVRPETPFTPGLPGGMGGASGPGAGPGPGGLPPTPGLPPPRGAAPRSAFGAPPPLPAQTRSAPHSSTRFTGWPLSLLRELGDTNGRKALPGAG